MNESEAKAVGQHYDSRILSYELERLQLHAPVEHDVTQRALEKWIPKGATVADIGVGSGLYAVALAQMGCDLFLCDVSEELLKATGARLQNLGLDCKVKNTFKASATDIPLPAAAADVVLLLGPLYHLRAAADRHRAVSEAVRILRPGGLLFAAGINKMGLLRWLFHQRPEQVVAHPEECERFLSQGNTDPDFAPSLHYSHMTNVAEFRSEFDGRFDELAMLGVEAFTSPHQSNLAEFSPDVRQAWIDIIEEIAQTPEGRGCADHFLYVGRLR